MKRIVCNEDFCIGCHLCEVYCITAHSKSKDTLKAYKEESPRQLNRVIVEEQNARTFAMQCRHCKDAPCLNACLTGAMSRDESTGAVLNDSSRCMGCWSCIMVCPFGAIQRDLKRGRVISKCDLCPDFDMPVCVANCPNKALKLVNSVNGVRED
ncbi:MAG: 4Fe-4S dicluster domain-containing protein [Candidatus Omnitrophica bacterium]|nr:4Fe-4S dicluster domain-containing protein [Candidatus Omnitrophota bacterium]